MSGATLDPVVISELRALARELGEDVLGEVVDAFEKSAPGLVGEIADGAGAVALDRVARAAHTLRSSSAQVGASALRDLATQLEKEARAGHAEVVSKLSTACVAELEAVLGALTAVVEERA